MTQTTLIQRIEGLAVLITAIALYAFLGNSWWMFGLLLLAPDLSMAGYWLGNQAGQMLYNLVHT